MYTCKRFFVFHFMDSAERQNLIRPGLVVAARGLAGAQPALKSLGTSVFGGVTFQKAVPLSYWDVRL